MIELTAQFDDDQAELLKPLVGKVVLIDRATVEAVYFGRVIVKMRLSPMTEVDAIISEALEAIPKLLADSKICLEWEKLTGSRDPHEYLTTRAAKEWPVRGDDDQ
jgi:hypothetical protein